MSILSAVIGRGVLASRPAAGSPGRVYFVTDGTPGLFRDNGSSWDSIGESGSAETLPASIGDAKGDLIGFTAADTPARVPVGSNGQVLTADSAQALGVKWAATAGSGAEAWETVMASLSGKVHRWTFEEASGLPQDSVGTLHATSGGGTITRSLSSPLGNAMRFTAALATTGIGSAPTGASPRTVVMAVRSTANDKSLRELFAYGTGATRQWFHSCMNHDGGDAYTVSLLFWGDDHIPPFPISDSSWHLIVLRYDGGRGQALYVDGSLTYRSTAGSLLTAASGNLAIAGNGVEFTDLTIFNRSLQHHELHRLWASFRALL